MTKLSYHVIGKKDGEEVIAKFNLSNDVALTVQKQWETHGASMIVDDARTTVQLDEVEIMPVEHIWGGM